MENDEMLLLLAGLFVGLCLAALAPARKRPTG
jgi:hypothetical protein